MCAPLVAAIPYIGGLLTTAGTAATATTAATAATFSSSALAALSIASTAASMYAQHGQAKAQARGIKTQQEHAREEVAEAAEEDLGQRIRASRERRARARVAAGESGALGASFAASINQSLTDMDMDAALVSKNAAFAQRGIDDRANTALSQIRDPSALEAGLQIASAGVSGYNAGLGIENLRSATPKHVPGHIPAGSSSPVVDPPKPLWPSD